MSSWVRIGDILSTFGDLVRYFSSMSMSDGCVVLSRKKLFRESMSWSILSCLFPLAAPGLLSAEPDMVKEEFW